MLVYETLMFPMFGGVNHIQAVPIVRRVRHTVITEGDGPPQRKGSHEDHQAHEDRTGKGREDRRRLQGVRRRVQPVRYRRGERLRFRHRLLHHPQGRRSPDRFRRP